MLNVHRNPLRLIANSLLSVLTGALLAACERPTVATPANAPPTPEPAEEVVDTLQVEAYYRERMLLPPGSQLLIALEDVSRMDVAATRISEQVLVDPGPPPYQVTLVYPADQINDRFRYGLRAQIRHQGQLLFTNTQHIDPFTQEQPVKVMMQGVAKPSEPAE